MRESSVLVEEKFWEVTDHMMGLNGPIRLFTLCQELQISEEQLTSFLSFFRELNVNFKVYEQNNEKWLEKPDIDKKIKLEFSLSEWLKFQAHFPVLGACKDMAYHSAIEDLLIETEEKYSKYDFFRAKENLDQKESLRSGLKLAGSGSSVAMNLSFLEEAILDEESVSFSIEGSVFDIFPYELLKFKGELNLVYENLKDSSLRVIPLKDIDSVQMNEESFNFSYTKEEVDKFIKELRQMDDLEERLILKVYDPKNFDTSRFQKDYLRNEVMVTTRKGHSVWASSIEPSNSFFEWVFDMGSSVEILGSEQFKKDYLEFCQMKLKRLA